MDHAPALALARPRNWGVLLGRLGTGAALALITAVLLYLQDHDGGYETLALAQVGGVALLAAPAVVSEARRIPDAAKVALVGWSCGLLLSSAFAFERSGATKPLLVYGLVPIVGLGALRMWRRTWGPPALLALALTSFGLYWFDAFLAWWGTLDLGLAGTPTWSALSSLNPSGALMGAFALLFLGIAVAGRRVIATVAGLAASAALAATWLTGSRGGLLTTVLGGVVVLVAVVRRGGASRLWRVLAVAALSVALVSGLAGMGAQHGSADGQDARSTAAPIANRQHGAARSAELRLLYVEGAAGMFAARPATGHGPGSFGVVSREFLRPDVELTASAHNEYAEMFAETGALGGLSFAVLGLLGAATVAAFALRPGRLPDAADDVRIPVALGCAGIATHLVLHAGIEFDWRYPILPSLMALAVAIVWHERRPDHRARDRGRTGYGVATVITLGAVLVIGLTATYVERRHAPAPWDTRAHVLPALEAAGIGDLELARSLIQRTRRWNPGDAVAGTVSAIVDFRSGVVSADALASGLEAPRTPLWTYNLAADALIDEDEPVVAAEVLDEVQSLYPAYAARHVGDPALETWLLRVRLAADVGGCAAAREVGAEAASDPLVAEADRRLRPLIDQVCAPR